jgi:hypothetical protein
MYLISYLENKLHNFQDFFFTGMRTSTGHTRLIFKGIRLFLQSWPGSCRRLCLNLRKENNTKALSAMFKLCFEGQYNIQTTIKRGVVFYVMIATLAMPAGLCSQQHQIPFYGEARYASALSAYQNPEKILDHEMALLDSLPWDDEQGKPSIARGGGKPAVSEDEGHRYHDYIVQAAETYQVDVALIKAVIMAESGYNPKAFDPALNIDAGVRYLRRLIDRFKGDVELALAAYNAGSRYVRKYGGVPPFRATRMYIRKVLKLRDSYLKEMADLTPTPPAV